MKYDKTDSDSELLGFLSAIKKCDAAALKEIQFLGEEFLYPLDGKNPKYRLKNISNNQIEICEILYDDAEIAIPETIDGRIVVGIGDKACYGKMQLKALILSEEIQYIKSGAFANCLNLAKVKLNNKLKYIGDINDSEDENSIVCKSQNRGAFENCSFENIELPETLEVLGDNTFRGCARLKAISLPGKIKRINQCCFALCDNLETITLPKNLIGIENAAFYGCKALQSIELPGSLTKIKHFAFQRCNNLSRVILRMGIKEIGISVFRGCENLKKITLPKSISAMHKYTFDPEKRAALTVNCEKNTYAWKYATENGFIVKDISLQ